MAKLFWVRADQDQPWEKRKKLVTTALESGADAVMVKPGEVETVKGLGLIHVISNDRSADIRLAKDACYKEIHNKEDEQDIVKLGKNSRYVIVNARNWKIIPLENIIAALRGKCKIIVEVANAKEAKVALETLEVGADGVLVNAGFSEIKGVKTIIDEMATEKLTLVPARITRIEPAGMGDRVCVDTTSMLNVGEGMLVGSQSNGMFLVHSESIETEYVASRPFRVNAGAVHAYVRMPEGRTSYLSELKAGSDILAVDWKGRTRKVTVGRSKIEKRPLILVEAKAEKRSISTMLQNAETILLVDKTGKPVSISRLKKDDEVLAYVEDAGRHFGMKVKESIEEK
ncbi:MAG: 3-dehydroquinate synthase II [Candidatus Altiarchaeota archaeon]